MRIVMVLPSSVSLFVLRADLVRIELSSCYYGDQHLSKLDGFSFWYAWLVDWIVF